MKITNIGISSPYSITGASMSNGTASMIIMSAPRARSELSDPAFLHALGT